MTARRDGGFTLIEILVVITIIGLLIGISSGVYTKYVQHGEESKTRSLIRELCVYADEYANLTGDFPPSLLKDLPEPVASTGDAANEGIEAFTLALFRQGYRGARPSSVSELENTDGDQADRNITDHFATPVLLEFVDSWTNPIVYFNCRDYGEAAVYLLESAAAARDPAEVSALRNPVTGAYYAFDSYQLISAGPDGVFDTDDDIANFEIKRQQ